MSPTSPWSVETQPNGSAGRASVVVGSVKTSVARAVFLTRGKERRLPQYRLRWTLLFAGFLQAIGMFLDAFQLLRGATGQPESMRMWARLVEWVGLDPAGFGPVFVVLGIAWVIVTVAILQGNRRAHKPAKIVAVASLWYLISGTGLAVIFLIALATYREPVENDERPD